MTDYTDVKNRLREYLERKGTNYDQKKKTYSCPNHSDENPSATIYENKDGHMLYCPVCSKSFNIFAVASMLENIPDDKEHFGELIKSVNSTLGIADMKQDKPKEKKQPDYVTLPRETAKDIYTRERILELFKMSKHSKLDMDKVKIINSWPYTDKDGNISGMDVRFEDGINGKEVITFWYNGKSLKISGAPVLIYNLQEVMSYGNKSILIVEGAKCCETAKTLEGFIPCSWSGGSAKVSLASWNFLANREVLILPDDDEAGIKAAKNIQSSIRHAKIVKPIEAARKIKPKGADIVEVLQIMSPDELTKYILNPDNHIEGIEKPSTPTPDSLQQGIKDGTPSRPGVEGSSMPFKILGMCDNEAHFIDEWGFYQHYRPDNLSKGKLNNIANLHYWKIEYQAKNGADWDEAINVIICFSKLKEFNSKLLKGIGAWKSGDKICYNNGHTVYGEKDDKFIYLKDTRYDVGIESEPAKPELLIKIKEILFNLSFETKVDAIRTMGWTVLAPFCGALEYRPTILMTGESGWGKSKVQTLFIKKITDMIHLDMRTTSEAGIRREIGKNSKPVFFDEGGKETDKMKFNHDSIIAYIRSSYSDDSPDGVKANVHSEGTVKYKNSSMFGIATTDPTIENIQDENRILRVNFVKPKHTADEWDNIENELIELLNPENCKAIRSLTWQRLKNIVKLSKRITQIARNKTNRDIRSSRADMLLASAYIIIWCDTLEPTQQQIEITLEKYYKYQAVEEHRSEANELIQEILNCSIDIFNEDKHINEKLKISECIMQCYELENDSDKKRFVLPLSRLGIKLVDKNIAIANNSDIVLKIIHKEKGFNKILKRHDGFVNWDIAIYFPHDKSTKKCTILKGIIFPEEDEDGDQIPF
jgi:hypothetical protein